MRIAFVACIVALVSLSTGTACEKDSSGTYPQPTNKVDEEIDMLLQRAEKALFLSNFNEALNEVEKVESLLPLTQDSDDHRKLRSMFDKAMIVTCIEGPTDNSYAQFAKFYTLFGSKGCQEATMAQPNLFDQNGHWPILGENSPISIEECLERVSTTGKALEIATAALQVHPATRMTIATAIYTITQRAKNCCTRDGFWKTCIQPIVDTWKKVELFGVPPDPSWD